MALIRADFVVVGAGIVGAATARAIQARHRQSLVVVIDKEHQPALHQSRHNSGVIHSGIYYKPGSAKARMCVRGAHRMMEFCEDHSIPYAVSGKLIVALREHELARLDELARQGRANSLSGIRLLNSGELREVEPYAEGIAALHVPGAASTNFAAVTRALLQDLTESGGQTIFGFEVKQIIDSDDTASVTSTTGEQIQASRIIVCAGLQSDRVASRSTNDDDMRILPFRGSYFRMRSSAENYVRSMIYPVPDARFPFLGVHFTRHIDGSVSCGPNAVIALAREKYGRLGFVPRDVLDLLTFKGTWLLARHHWRDEYKEVLRDINKRIFVADARRYLPALQSSDLIERHCGIRAQAVQRNGNLLDDFSFVHSGNVTYVRNAPSPAATASLELADHIVESFRPIP